MLTEPLIIHGPLPGAAQSITRHHQNLKEEEYTNPKRLMKVHGTL
jgi:hypothetical protein